MIHVHTDWNRFCMGGCQLEGREIRSAETRGGLGDTIGEPQSNPILNQSKIIGNSKLMIKIMKNSESNALITFFQTFRLKLIIDRGYIRARIQLGMRFVAKMQKSSRKCKKNAKYLLFVFCPWNYRIKHFFHKRSFSVNSWLLQKKCFCKFNIKQFIWENLIF